MKTKELIEQEIKHLNNDLLKIKEEEHKAFFEPFLKQKFFRKVYTTYSEFVYLFEQCGEFLIGKTLTLYNDESNDNYCPGYCNTNSFSLKEISKYERSTKQEYESALNLYFQRLKKNL